MPNFLLAQIFIYNLATEVVSSYFPEEETKI